MPKSYLQDIVKDVSFESLPVKWQDFDFKTFSTNKTLFDFQEEALKNAIKALYLYFKEKNANKKEFHEYYKLNGLTEDLDYNITKESKIIKYLLEYPDDYQVINNKISFSNFINQMSFWMATGSGKTLVIIKLIEVLNKLINRKEIPDGDILFLTYRQDLIDQFKKHVEEFNSLNFDTKIELKSLKEYEDVKRQSSITDKNKIIVFYYRSDLISDEQKESIINFRNYDNHGKWYILLDEAHKGKKDDSKRQILYSILSRNRFLFNFSATFTDVRDITTCVFNFNLAKFVEEGYGKHIYLSSTEIKAFREENDFSPIDKQKIVLKTLLLLTYLHKNFEHIRKTGVNLYHRPLLLTLVDSVDVEDSDLQLFFKELEKVGNNQIRTDLFEKAKKELAEEFSKDNKFEFEDLECIIDADSILKLEYKDILAHVFNAKTPGKTEVLKIPGNNQELIFKLMTSDKPFALIKIGDISSWLKDKLEGYEINESYSNESYFNKLNHDDSDINILMGSRAFYEGWDSNRPNIILFINIGIGKESKKFVLQSVGRGVRIEPLKFKRKRLQNLYNSKSIDEDLYEKMKDLVIKNQILPIETLFIFGTKAENLKDIVGTLREIRETRNIGEEFIVNPDAENRLLLVPVYKISNKIFADENRTEKYSISKDDLNLSSQFYQYLGDKVTVAKYGCDIKILNKVKESFDKAEYFYDFSETNSLLDPELTLDRIFNYFGIKSKELEKFKELENEIIHFKRINFSDGEKYEELRKKIETIRSYPEKKKELDMQYGRIPSTKFIKQMTLLNEAGEFEMKGQKINIKYLANHYYLPVIVSESEKVNYINHIINVESEVKFIKELEEYLDKPDNVFSQFDWWMFSKIDQSLDDISVPYYNPKENSIANFKPDFIFWMQKGKKYLILFVDPKGTEHTDSQRKIDGFSKIFEIEKNGRKQVREFKYEKFTVNTMLLLKPRRGIASVPENYRRYWFDNFDDFANKIRDVIGLND